jgi:hypothetical protein
MREASLPSMMLSSALISLAAQPSHHHPSEKILGGCPVSLARVSTLHPAAIFFSEVTGVYLSSKMTSTEHGGRRRGAEIDGTEQEETMLRCLCILAVLYLLQCFDVLQCFIHYTAYPMFSRW